jgi:hypothetical protein
LQWSDTSTLSSRTFELLHVGGEGVTLGDANGDGKIGTADLQVLGANWLPPQNKIPPGDWRADFNGDGKVGTADLQILGANWLPPKNNYGPVPPDPAPLQ